MIFNENFDRSLWMIIKNDRKNRDRIVHFIKSIPYELIIMIQEVLVEYNKYRYFSKQVYDSIGDLYSFSIDSKDDILSITRSIYINGAYYSNFNIQLRCNDYNTNFMDVKPVGNISFCLDGRNANRGYAYLGNTKNVSYDVIDFSFTRVLRTSVNGDIYKFCGIIDKTDDIDLSLDKINGCLIKTKKINDRRENKNV